MYNCQDSQDNDNLMQFKSRIKTIFNPNIRGIRLLPQFKQNSSQSSKSQTKTQDLFISTFNDFSSQLANNDAKQSDMLSSQGKFDNKRLSLNSHFVKPIQDMKKQFFGGRPSSKRQGEQKSSSILNQKQTVQSVIYQANQVGQTGNLQTVEINKQKSYNVPETKYTKVAKSFSLYNGTNSYSLNQFATTSSSVMQPTKLQTKQKNIQLPFIQQQKLVKYTESSTQKPLQKKQQNFINDNNEKLKTQINQLKIQLGKQKQKNNNLAYQLQQTEKQKKKSDDAINFSRSISQNLMKREKQLNLKIKQMQNHFIVMLKSQKQRIKQQCDRINSLKIQHLQKQIFQLKLSLIDEKNSVGQKLENLKNQYSRDLQKKNQELEYAYKQLNQKQKKQKNINNSVNSLENQIENQKLDVTRQKQLYQAKSQENNNLKNKIIQITKEKDTISEQNNHLKQQLNQFKKSSQIQLENHDKQLSKQKVELSRQKQISEARYLQNIQLKVQIDTLNKQNIAKMETLMIQKDKKIEHLINQKNTIIFENSNLKQQINRLERQVEQINHKKQEMIQKMQEKDNIIGQLTKKRNSLLLELVELKQNIKKLNNQIQKLGQNLIRYQNIIVEKEKELKIMKDKYTDLQQNQKQQKNLQKNQNQQQTLKKNQFIKQISSKQQQIQVLKQELSRIKEASSSKQILIEKWQLKCKDLQCTLLNIKNQSMKLKVQKQKDIIQLQKIYELKSQKQLSQHDMQGNRELRDKLQKQERQNKDLQGKLNEITMALEEKSLLMVTLQKYVQKLQDVITQQQTRLKQQQHQPKRLHYDQSPQQSQQKNKQSFTLQQQLKQLKQNAYQNKLYLNNFKEQEFSSYQTNLHALKDQYEALLTCSQDQKNQLKISLAEKIIEREQLDDLVKTLQKQKENLEKDNLQIKIQYLNQLNALKQSQNKKQKQFEQIQIQKTIIQDLLKILNEQKQNLEKQNLLKDSQISKLQQFFHAEKNKNKNQEGFLENKCRDLQKELWNLKNKSRDQMELLENDMNQNQEKYREIISQEIKKLQYFYEEQDLQAELEESFKNKHEFSPGKCDNSMEDILEPSNDLHKYEPLKLTQARSLQYLTDHEKLRQAFEEKLQFEISKMKMKIQQIQYLNFALRQKIQELNLLEQTQNLQILEKIQEFQNHVQRSQKQKEQIMMLNDSLKTQINQMLSHSQAQQSKIQWLQNTNKQLQNYINEINQEMLRYQMEILNLKHNGQIDDENQEIVKSTQEISTNIQVVESVQDHLVDNCVNLDIFSKIDEKKVEMVDNNLRMKSRSQQKQEPQDIPNTIQQPQQNHIEQYTEMIILQQQTFDQPTLKQTYIKSSPATTATAINKQNLGALNEQEKRQQKEKIIKEQHFDQHQQYDIYLQSVLKRNQIMPGQKVQLEEEDGDVDVDEDVYVDDEVKEVNDEVEDIEEVNEDVEEVNDEDDKAEQLSKEQ